MVVKQEEQIMKKKILKVLIPRKKKETSKVAIPRKKKKILKVVIPIVVVVGLVGTITVKNAESAAKAVIEAMKVEAITVEKGDVSQIIETNGVVVSGEQKTIFSPVNAKIELADFQAGDLVKEGQKLITFNLKDLEEQNQKAELTIKANELGYQDTLNKSYEAAARQAEARSQVDSLQSQVDAKRQEAADLTAAIAGDAQAQAEAAQRQMGEVNVQIESLQKDLEKALKTLDKLKVKYDKAVEEQQIAQVNFDAAAASGETEELEKAREALNKANAKVTETERAYQAQKEITDNLNNQIVELQTSLGEIGTNNGTNAELQQRLETVQAELAQLEGNLESQRVIAETDAGTLSNEARAQMQANNNLAELESKSLEELIEAGKQGVSAEFNGVISEKQVLEGALVSQGMQLFTLQSIDNVNVEITLSKNVYDKVKEGQKAEIILAGNNYKGTISRISRIAMDGIAGSNQAAVSSASIKATVHIDNPDNNIFLGVDAKVKILAAEAKDVVILPTEAINIGKDGTFCWICQDGLLKKQAITTGVTSDECAEITEGIEAGEQVIADPENHEEGDKILITESNIEE